MAAPDFKVAPTVLGHAIIPPGGVSGQSLHKASGTDYDTAWATPSRSIADVHADASVVNSTTETTLATLAIPTTAASGDVLEFAFWGDVLNNTASNVTYTWRLKLGATTVFNWTAFSMTSGATRRAWMARGELLVVTPSGGTPDERLEMWLALPGQTGLQIAVGYLAGIATHGTAAEDLSAGKNLALTMQLGTASASADCYLHEATLAVSKR